jgi:hypothetical protein
MLSTLFARLGSNWSPSIVAVFTIWSGAFTVTVMVKVGVAVGTTVPTVQTPVPLS